MRALNLGILAHIDAGKTSLTERLLYQAGVIDEIGSVDKGSTQTDSLHLERQRGITIKSAVVSFTLLDTAVNLIDTPGHPDFIAEVERVLSVLDGVVLVVSAVEGVQAQTLVLMRALRRLRIPTLIFVNKVDRRGARCGEVVRVISERLSPSIVVMGAADHAMGTKDAEVTRFTGDDEGFVKDLADLLARHDDALLADFLDDERLLSYERLRAALAAATRQARVHPVYLGSAVTGAGIDALTEGIRELLPAAPERADADLSAGVFKVERGPAGEKISYVRVFEGAIRVRDRLAVRGDKESKVTAVGVFDSGEVVRRDSVEAGRIAKVWGLTDVRIGDTLGARPGWAVERQFSPPSLETAVVPDRPADRGALYAALAQLAEQDPLIGLRHDALRNEFYLSLYGEVQKEVVEATLLDEYGLRASFQETSVICVERPVGTGEAFEIKNKGVNPFLATVGIRIDPAPVGSGVAYRIEVELGAMPYAFMKVVEDTARETLRQGLCGWEVTDCTLTLTHSGYNPRQSHSHATFDKAMSSTGADFRGLTPLVVMDALQEAGTRVHEPVHRFHLEIPADTFGVVIPVLAELRGVPGPVVTHGSICTVEGEIPAARVHEFQRSLPPLTRGEGVLDAEFARYAAVSGPPPVRRRSDANPLNRKEYLLRVMRNV